MICSAGFRISSYGKFHACIVQSKEMYKTAAILDVMKATNFSQTLLRIHQITRRHGSKTLNLIAELLIQKIISSSVSYERDIVCGVFLLREHVDTEFSEVCRMSEKEFRCMLKAYFVTRLKQSIRNEQQNMQNF